MAQIVWQSKMRYQRRAHKARMPSVEQAAGLGGYVYIIGMSNDIYKIGVSGNYQSRFASIETSNPLAHVVNARRVTDMRKCEKVLHRRYKGQCVKGEWFRLTTENIESILKYLDKHTPPMIPAGMFRSKK